MSSSAGPKTAMKLPSLISICLLLLLLLPDPASSAPSTSKISYESIGGRRSRENRRRGRVDEKEEQEEKEEKREQVANDTSEVPEAKPAAPVVEAEKSKVTEVGPTEGVEVEDSSDRKSVLQDTFDDFKEDESNHDFLSELEKVQEAIDSFNQEDHEFQDEFRLQSPESVNR